MATWATENNPDRPAGVPANWQYLPGYRSERGGAYIPGRWIDPTIGNGGFNIGGDLAGVGKDFQDAAGEFSRGGAWTPLAIAAGIAATGGAFDPTSFASGGADALAAGSEGFGGAELASSPYSLASAGGGGLSVPAAGGGTLTASGVTSAGANLASKVPTVASGIFGTGITAKDALLGGAQFLGAKLGSDAAKDAASTQAASARDALGLQSRIYDESVARSKPFYDTSVQANSKLSRLLGLNGEQPLDVLAEDPGYQFRKDEGQKAVDNGAAARGMSLSGGAMKALQKYGQDYASGEYNNVYNRLSSTAGGGQVANNVNSTAGNYGNNASSLITGSGNAQAAGTVGSANAWSSGLSGVVNNYQQNQLLNLLTKNKVTE